MYQNENSYVLSKDVTNFETVWVIGTLDSFQPHVKAAYISRIDCKIYII